ncbi:hypothetical protein RUM43_007647 [Polyplax serrata]|uniref:Uncharacterized protein n=1 Tax=Polyplax serrata TaxID=468196 RepID=A0AAN8P669_POLSC
MVIIFKTCNYAEKVSRRDTELNTTGKKNGYAKISGLHSCKLMMETLVNSLKKENISYNPIDLRMAEEDEIRKNLESREFLGDYSVAFTGNSLNVHKHMVQKLEIHQLEIVTTLLKFPPVLRHKEY